MKQFNFILQNLSEQGRSSLWVKACQVLNLPTSFRGCREAGESVLTFLTRLFEKDTLLRSSKESSAALLAVFTQKGAVFFRLLVAAAAGAVPPARVYHISETIATILKVRCLSIFCLRLLLIPLQQLQDD